MTKKFGLGKGLGALIPDENSNDDSIFKVEINLIKPNNSQPRKNFDEDKIFQLSESIKEHGIIQPLVLKKQGKFYLIVAGERRWRAAKAIGLKEVPAVILDLDDKQVLEISLIENIQREDLNPIEEAIAYKKLLEEFDFTQELLSKRIGKSRAAIANCIRLLNLDSRVQEYLIEGVISEGHGRALLPLEDNDLQYKFAQMIIDEQLNVRDVESLIKNIGKNKKLKKQNENNPYYNDIKAKLESFFDTKVIFKTNGNKGKIMIEYYSEEELQRIIDILNI